MKRYILLLLFVFSVGVSAQVPMPIKVEIAQAEDARRYDQVLEGLMKWPGAELRIRAALAAGRIGDDKAIPALVALLENDRVPEVRVAAAFAIGEIESIKGADAILRAIGETARAQVPGVREPENGNRARLVEAAGKIAAANAQDLRAKDLAQAIMFTLQAELLKGAGHDKPTVLQAVTAALRARPANADATVQKFLAFTDPDIVATALNTLARLRAKNANRDARDLLATHVHAIVRANAARLLGAAEDKEALDVLVKAATTDSDSRVRVSAIRAVGTLKDAKGVDSLIAHGRMLLAAHGKSKLRNPNEKSELLEIASALGQLLPKTEDSRAVRFLNEFRIADSFHSPETEIALARVGPKRFLEAMPEQRYWQFPYPNSGALPQSSFFGSYSRGLGELSTVGSDNPNTEVRAKAASKLLELLAILESGELGGVRLNNRELAKQLPDVLGAYAKFKPNDLGEVLRRSLQHSDVQVRATAAGLLEDLPSSLENIDALNTAFNYAWEKDIQSNDAILATMDALFKVDKQNPRASITAFMLASASPDHLVRAKALGYLKDDAYKAKPELQAFLNSESAKKLSVVGRYGGNGTKNGQILNRNIDYRRALSRKNGTVKAVLTTEKGPFTIDFYPEEAPLTVDNFIKLARSGYFNGVEVHRVVPNFVMQDGDPRGDGNGGPGWSIRCEVNMLPYERGMVGMALSGKDTGGSQWFVTHSPQPHLDGGYTIFGRVNEKDMKVVDNIVRGDKILTVKIVGR